MIKVYAFAVSSILIQLPVIMQKPFRGGHRGVGPQGRSKNKRHGNTQKKFTIHIFYICYIRLL